VPVAELQYLPSKGKFRRLLVAAISFNTVASHASACHSFEPTHHSTFAEIASFTALSALVLPVLAPPSLANTLLF
jgi:hypothetical protein